MPTSSTPLVSRAVNPSTTREPRLFLAGLGSVGGALLRQLQALPDDDALPLAGACTSRRAIWYEVPQPADVVASTFADAEATDWAHLLERLESTTAPLVFVDATGSVEVARYHARLLEAGCSIVTPSKHGLTQEQDYFDRLQRAVTERPVSYHYETTVGAGLPIVRALKDLLRTGDRVERLRGAASGTLSFLFSQLREGKSFSTAVHAAIERGYAEPDVREDLSGEDVARKFLILGRTMGLKLERSDVHVKSLVPEALREHSLDRFLEALPHFDAAWTARTQEARDRGAVLQYVGQLTDDQVRVTVEEVPEQSSFGQLTDTDNLFELHTARYRTTPLSVRGPGAGPDVTAAGVLSGVFNAFHPTQ